MNDDKKKILVVDDEKDITLLVKLNLERTGRYEVREENRAMKAISVAKEFKPDLVLMDVVMPEMDGGDVVAQIKKNIALKNVPVIFITATVLKEDIDNQGGKIGGYTYIPKPISANGLVRAIEKQLGIAPSPTPEKGSDGKAAGSDGKGARAAGSGNGPRKTSTQTAVAAQAERTPLRIITPVSQPGALSRLKDSLMSFLHRDRS